jgi:hypothetical protein
LLIRQSVVLHVLTALQTAFKQEERSCVVLRHLNKY